MRPGGGGGGGIDEEQEGGGEERTEPEQNPKPCLTSARSEGAQDDEPCRRREVGRRHTPATVEEARLTLLGPVPAAPAARGPRDEEARPTKRRNAETPGAACAGNAKRATNCRVGYAGMIWSGPEKMPSGPGKIPSTQLIRRISKDTVLHPGMHIFV